MSDLSIFLVPKEFLIRTKKIINELRPARKKVHARITLASRRSIRRFGRVNSMTTEKA